MVAKACERSNGRFRAEHVRDLGISGKWQLWIALSDSGEICAAGGTQIIDYPTGLKALYFRFGTGSNRRAWQHVVEQMKAWGKSQGCQITEGPLRKGWRRVLPGWTHTHDYCEQVL